MSCFIHYVGCGLPSVVTHSGFDWINTVVVSFRVNVGTTTIRYVDALLYWQHVLDKTQLPHYFLEGDHILQEVGLIPKAESQLRTLHAHVSAVLKKYLGVCSPDNANNNSSKSRLVHETVQPARQL